MTETENGKSEVISCETDSYEYANQIISSWPAWKQELVEVVRETPPISTTTMHILLGRLTVSR